MILDERRSVCDVGHKGDQDKKSLVQLGPGLHEHAPIEVSCPAF